MIDRVAIVMRQRSGFAIHQTVSQYLACPWNIPAKAGYSHAKGIHPQTHLQHYAGILQADAYAGYNALYESGRILEAACWAHVRRKFYDIHVSRPFALNLVALAT